jgi:AcrR family transcriptional regulator
MKREIRIPQQKRSIEKKNNIIKAAYRVFNDKGYNNINTAEIAKEAGISTGCLYDYFIDKKDIFLEVLKMHTNTIIDIVSNKLRELSKDEDLLSIIKKFIYILLESHNHSEGFHQEVMALSCLDADVKNHFKSYHQQIIMNKLIDYFKERNIHMKNEKEKMILLLNTVDCLCHELVYNPSTVINTDIIIDECAHMIEYLLKS